MSSQRCGECGVYIAAASGHSHLQLARRDLHIQTNGNDLRQHYRCDHLLLDQWKHTDNKFERVPRTNQHRRSNYDAAGDRNSQWTYHQRCRQRDLLDPHTARKRANLQRRQRNLCHASDGVHHRLHSRGYHPVPNRHISDGEFSHLQRSDHRFVVRIYLCNGDRQRISSE